MDSKDTPKIPVRLASILIDMVVVALYGALLFSIFFVTLTNIGDAVPHIDPTQAKFGTIAPILPVMLLFMLPAMALFAKDGRHFGDVLAGTRVVSKRPKATLEEV